LPSEPRARSPACDAAFLNGDVKVGGRGVIPSHITYWPTNATSASAAEDSLLVVTNTAATTISTITGGTSGQRLTLLFMNANTTVADNTGNLRLAGTFAPTIDDVLELMYYGGHWVEVGRSAN
jgi:hypothetical protein